MLTVDEANEETISAFEEIDASVDSRIKKSVCLVIDLQGFFCAKEHFHRHAFFQPAALKGLSHKEKKSFKI